MAIMNGVVLPGNSTVEHVQVDGPEPGPGQVLLQMKASSICGSDIRAIYRQRTTCLRRKPTASCCRSP